ncbi:MAG TPA: hypothetical protein DCS93_42460 [Microscillaceae bacterium]|nr:hypothetical protein [Microscillaceae bacterium]
MDFKKDLLDAWHLNTKVTLYLLENIEPEWLPLKLQGKGRSIGEQFVHINNIRSYWIGKVGTKEDLKIDKKYGKDKVQILTSLTLSGAKMANTLQEILDQEDITGYKPHPLAFYSQMIAHEAHHRGQVMAAITRNDLPISKSVNFGLWNWNNK